MPASTEEKKREEVEWSDVENKFFSDEERETLDQTLEIVSTIINRRIDLKLTQSDVAKKTGLKQSAISRFEKMNVVPCLDTVIRLAKALGLQLKFEDCITGK